MSISWLPLLASGLFLLTAAILLMQSRLAARAEQVIKRLDERRFAGRSKLVSDTAWSKFMLRTGLKLPATVVVYAALMVGLALLLVIHIFGWLVALITLALMLVLGYSFLQWRYQRRIRKIISQLPVLLDHMMRSLRSGRSLGDATALAIDQAPNPLQEAMMETRRSIELGVPLSEAVDELALTYKREEFHILAIGIQVNQRYGGTASELLQSLISLIRDREKGRDQLQAMTGETRVSALVLGGLPLAVMVFLFIMNPDFLMNLLHDVQGRMLLGLALLLQAVGCYLLWRMMRSI